MMDGLHDLRSEFNHIVGVVAFEAELNACYYFCMVDLLQEDGQLADYVVYAWAYLA